MMDKEGPTPEKLARHLSGQPLSGRCTRRQESQTHAGRCLGGSLTRYCSQMLNPISVTFYSKTLRFNNL